MTRLYYTVLTVFYVFAFSSCHSMVEDEFENYEPVPVMNGLLQADSTMRIQISLTANLADSTPEFVDNALVIIESDVNTRDTLSYTSEGWYVSPQRVKAGATYTCKAIIPDLPIIDAQTTIPVPTEIDSIVYNDLVGRNEDGYRISSIEFRIRNDTKNKKFWLVKLKEKRIGMYFNSDTEEWTEGYHEYDKYFYMKAGQDSVMLNEANPLELFSNIKMKNEQYWVKTYFDEYSEPDFSKNYFVELLNVDESYYKYVKQYYIYGSAEEIAIGKSQQRYPLYSNVNNGLGVFTSLSVSRKEFPNEN